MKKLHLLVVCGLVAITSSQNLIKKRNGTRTATYSDSFVIRDGTKREVIYGNQSAALFLDNQSIYRCRTNKEAETFLRAVQRKCPTVSKCFTLPDRTTKGNPIVGIIFGMVPHRHVQLVPEIKLVANVNGGDLIGKELLLELAKYLCDQYIVDNTNIIQLFQMTRIHIVPSMNPDIWGETFEKYSNNTESLKNPHNLVATDYKEFRNYVDLLVQNKLPKNHRLPKYLNQETQAMLNWYKSEQFMLSLDIRSGGTVISYPYFSKTTSGPRYHSSTPDEDVFIHLAKSYTKYNPYIGPQCLEKLQRGRIVNGGMLEGAEGILSNYNYKILQCMEIRLQMNCLRYIRNHKEFLNLWAMSKPALINYMFQAHIGIKGIIFDVHTNKSIPGACMKVYASSGSRSSRNEKKTCTGLSGEYFRPLLNGFYVVIIGAKNYQKKIITIEIINSQYCGAKELSFGLKNIKSM